MKKVIINPTTLAAPVGHFDRAVRIGDWLFVSGTSALTNAPGELKNRKLVTGIEAQTNEALNNIQLVLDAAGARFDQVYEVRITLRNPAEYSIVDRIFRERVPHKGFIAHAYGGTMVHPDMEIEIEVNAYLGADH